MKLSNEERLEVGKAFKASKKYLYSGVGQLRRRQRTHICYAIEQAYVFDPRLEDAGLTAKMIISSRLGKSATVTSWLNKQKEVNPADLIRKNIQAYRHRWLDVLIKEFSV